LFRSVTVSTEVNFHIPLSNDIRNGGRHSIPGNVFHIADVPDGQFISHLTISQDPDVRFEVLTASNKKITVFWNVTSYSSWLGSSECWYPSAVQHGVIFQKTTEFRNLVFR
jgi:hypothetical protein